MKFSKIKPRKPTRDERLIAVGFLSSISDRLDAHITSLKNRANPIDPIALDVFKKQRDGLRAVADWLKPRKTD